MRDYVSRSVAKGVSRLVRVGLGIALLLAGAAVVRALPPPPVTPVMLSEAERVWTLNEMGDMTECIRQSHLIVRAADALRLNARLPEAKELYRRAALVRPWDFAMKMDYAEVLAGLGETAAARSRAEEVLALAETEVLQARARAILGKPAPASGLPSFSSLHPAPGERTIRLIVPPDTEPWLVAEVGRNLAMLLGVRVGLDDRLFDCGKPARTGRAELAAELRKSLPWDKERMELYVPRGKRVPPQMLTDDQVIEVGRKMLKGDAADEAEQQAYRLRVEEAGKRLQWDVVGLLAGLQQQYPVAAGGDELRLALLPVDVSGGGATYLYGTASIEGRCAVVSYYRFSAACTGEPAKRARLADRTLKQVLSSLGFALGLPRCDDARCARSYPANLLEQDAKGADLCDECRAGFAKALGHELPPRAE